jgi:hypothetical protein
MASNILGGPRRFTSMLMPVVGTQEGRDDDMKEYLLDQAMRFFFLVAATIIWTGIYLTGFRTAHWVLYIPAVFFLFAAVTGICPGIIISNKLFRKKPTETSEK